MLYLENLFKLRKIYVVLYATYTKGFTYIDLIKCEGTFVSTNLNTMAYADKRVQNCVSEGEKINELLHVVYWEYICVHIH